MGALGQGFPDWSCPEFCKDAVAKAALSDFNQYARGAGHLPLVKVLAEEYGRSMGRTIDPLTEVTVTSGATGGMFNLWQGLLSEGDEVILMEPAFDIYAPQVQFAGGKCAYVPLRLSPATGEWKLDIAELEAAITPKTRAILINTPHVSEPIAAAKAYRIEVNSISLLFLTRTQRARSSLARSWSPLQTFSSGIRSCCA